MEPPWPAERRSPLSSLRQLAEWPALGHFPTAHGTRSCLGCLRVLLNAELRSLVVDAITSESAANGSFASLGACGGRSS